jgi:hypothetical protein
MALNSRVGKCQAEVGKRGVGEVEGSLPFHFFGHLENRVEENRRDEVLLMMLDSEGKLSNGTSIDLSAFRAKRLAKVAR